MKKRLLPITILAALGMSALVGCGGSAPAAVVDVTGVTLNKTTVEIVKGQTEQLTATIAPANATDKTVTWKSADTSVATVADGLVSALDVGSTKVTVTTNDGGFKAECTVNVVLAMNSITISNKAAFAEGLEVGSNKAVAVSGEPAINATELANKGYLTIASSDTTVATTNKLVVYAVKAGTTTITASLFGKTDSFQLTVKEVSNKDKFGTDHEGDAADPFTNEDALKAAKWLKANGGYGTTKYYVRGEVDYFYHNPGERSGGEVSYFLKPATAGGEQFEIYKCFKQDGSALTDQDVYVGGVATAFGAFTDYNGQFETDSATFVSCEGTAPAPRAVVAMTFAEALAAGKACKDGAATYDKAQFEAYVTAKDGKDNFFLTATKAEAIGDDKTVNTIELQSFGMADAVKEVLLKNAKVKVTNSLKNYHGQVENLFSVTADSITVVEAGVPWVEPDPEFLAVADPVVGTKYKLGMKFSARGDKGDKFLTGVKDGNYGAVTDEFNKGVDAEIVAGATADKYYVKLTYADSSVKYLGHVVSTSGTKTYVNIAFDEEATTEFTYDATAHTLFFDANNGVYYFGTYGTNITAGTSQISYITGDNAGNVDKTQFPVHFCTKGERPALEKVDVSPAESDVNLFGQEAAQVVDLVAAPSPKAAELGEVTWSTDKADKGVTVVAGKVTIPLDFVAVDATDDITVTASAGGKSGTAVIHVSNKDSGGDTPIANPVVLQYSDFGLSGTTTVENAEESKTGVKFIISKGTAANGIAKSGTMTNQIAIPGKITKIEIKEAKFSAETKGEATVYVGATSGAQTTSVGVFQTSGDYTYDVTGSYSFITLVLNSQRTLKFTSITITYEALA